MSQVRILGVHLPDHHAARYALTHIYGVGPATSAKICARFQIHDRCKVKDLSPFQTAAISSFLSAPHTSTAPPRYPLADPDFIPLPANTPFEKLQGDLMAARARAAGAPDKMKELRVGVELKRDILENLAHQRMIGSYVGLRHSMNLPVRGQRTKTNRKSARKLNRIERRL